MEEEEKGEEDKGEEGAEGKGSREIKDPPGIGGSGPGEVGKKALFGGGLYYTST